MKEAEKAINLVSKQGPPKFYHAPPVGITCEDVEPMMFGACQFFAFDNCINEKLTITKHHWLCVYPILT